MLLGKRNWLLCLFNLYISVVTEDAEQKKL